MTPVDCNTIYIYIHTHKAMPRETTDKNIQRNALKNTIDHEMEF